MEVNPTLPEDLAELDESDARDLPRAILNRAVARFQETEAIVRRNEALADLDSRTHPWIELEYIVASEARTHLLRAVLATDPDAGNSLTNLEHRERPTRGIVVDGVVCLATPDEYQVDSRPRPNQPNRMTLVTFPFATIRDLGDLTCEVPIETVAGHAMPVPPPDPEREADPPWFANMLDLIRYLGPDEARVRLLRNLPQYRQPPTSGS